MTKTDLSTANKIYVRTIELLLQRVAEYEQTFESCVVLQKETYKEMIEDFHAMKNRLAEIEGAQ